MCADVGLEAFEYQSEQYWPYSGLDLGQERRHDAFILYGAVLCDPLGPNMCADVGLEAYECILDL